ncbi:MAG TPA: F0F1 ATP synthase subunit B [Rhodopila sp.]|jgi:F-type H+-transporting ATPase subunit b|nr:F0F1 ATP synthase subunit B [Rhodopila sp.]
MHEPGFFAEPRNWVVLAFILFFVLFGKKLWAALATMLDARAVAVKAELEEAQVFRREAAALLKDAERQRDEAVKDAKALIDGAKAEAGRITAAVAAEAEASAKRREKMAIDRIAAAEKAAVDEVRLAAADIATAAARQVLTEDLTPEADAKLIDQAITQLPSALAAARHAA